MTPKSRPTKAAFVIPNPKAKLLDQLREVLRVKHYSLRTEETYAQWTTRFLKFHREQTVGGSIRAKWGHRKLWAFLSHLANVENVAGATQNQALNALNFLYSEVLHAIFTLPRSCPHLARCPCHVNISTLLPHFPKKRRSQNRESHDG
jgi:hypothetical protein